MRRLLISFGLLAAATPLFAFSCSSKSSNTEAAADAGADVSDLPPTPSAWDAPVTRPTDTAAQTARAACTYARGDMPAATLGTSTPVDVDIPIENVIIVMKENHSFDNYFGHLNEFGHRTDIEEAPADAGNPEQVGVTGSPMHPYQHAPHLCTLDTDHEWDGAHLEFDNGQNDGFWQANNGWDVSSLNADAAVPPAPDGGGSDGGADAGGPVPTLAAGDRSLYYYDQTDLPFLYSLANTFAIADHYFCSILGPTWPNRMYLTAATSFGETYNTYPNLVGYDFPSGMDATIIDELERRHTTWGIYSAGEPGIGVVYGPLASHRWSHGYDDLTTFMQLAQSGNLPQLSIVDPDLTMEGPMGDDDHPPDQVQLGEQWTYNLVQAVMSSPQWAHTALFITWDENGGFYDHVPPPKACAPDTTAPMLDTGMSAPGGFDQYGFRVGLVVVSPYAKAGYVGHTVYDHTSITRFVEAKFKIPALTARDANADPLMDLFDFQNPPFVTPPTFTAPPVDTAEETYCVSNYPGP
jgi:phospholipase C